jgi:hypothetical protein
MLGGYEKCMQNFDSGTFKSRDYFEVVLLRWTFAVVNRRQAAGGRRLKMGTSCELF